MVNSILIGKEIYNLLNNSPELKKHVGDKIYPLVADNDVTFPFVLYYRTNIRNLVNKDGYYEDEVSFSIIVVAKSYFESLEIANEVRKIFQKKRLGNNIYNVVIDDVDEDFRDNAYIQQLFFQCKMSN